MNTTQTQLKAKKEKLEEVFFSGNLSVVELNKMRKEIIKVSKKITPEPIPQEAYWRMN